MSFKIIFHITFIFVAFINLKSQTVQVETITTPFNASGGVAIDDSGIVYVADFGFLLGVANGSIVYKVYDDGTVTPFASGFSGASGNDFDSQGNLYQSNINRRTGNKLSKITPDGTVSTFATSGITGPVGVAVSAEDTIYVANCGGNSIAKVAPDGTSSVWVSHAFLNCPNGLTIDDQGNLYTCNFNNGNVVKITPDKDVTILATVPGGRCGHLTFFEGVLYVAARCASQIYKVTLDGEVSLLAGTGERGNADGPGLSATFNHPNGIRAKKEGEQTILYVNDATALTGDCTSADLNPVVIRKITIDPFASGFGPQENQPVNTFKLEQNYPNPFNPQTKIKYFVRAYRNKPQQINLSIYNQLGQKVVTLVDGRQLAGSYTVNWDASGMPGGVYFYRMKSSDFIQTRKMLLIK